MKKCVKCKITYSLDNFNKDKRRKDGYDYVCRTCKKEYYKQNKTNILLKSQEYYLKNSEKVAQYMRIYQSKEDNKERRRENNKERWKNEEQYRIRMCLGWKVNQSIQKKYKVLSSLELLGCTIEQVRAHIENQFKPEMNWGNHGEIWEIDHIKPCVSFDLTNIEQQKECFNYKNLQPLFKTTKIAKSFGYNDIGNRNKSKYEM
jgi:hypothetical protein